MLREIALSGETEQWRTWARMQLIKLEARTFLKEGCMQPQESSSADDENPLVVPPDAVVRLSKRGRAVYERFLRQCREIAGRELTFDDVIKGSRQNANRSR